MNWPAFANPWMLGALAAIGLPVLIHYLTRARPRKIAFPPFKFLVEACAGQQTVNRLRTIVLLTVRCLAIAALVLLFARPFLKPTGPTATMAAKRVVLVLDASLSMRAVQRGTPLFARAQAEAADVLRTLESGSEAAVILAGATPRPLLPALSRNVPALHEQLVKTQPTYELGDLAAALALAKQFLGGSGTIYIFSDFQQSNWDKAKDLPAGVVCRLRPVCTAPVDNVALTAMRIEPAEPVAGESTEVICTVFNCTPRARQEMVRLELGDFAQERRVTIQPYGSAEAAFSVTFQRAGSITGKASLAPDDLIEDNTRFVAVRVHKALQILLASNSDPTDRHSGAYFVNRALAPSSEAAPGLTVVRRHGQDADRGILETADAFVLVSPVTLSSEAVEIINRRVAEGAQLMVFLEGPQAPLLSSFAPPFRMVREVSRDADSLTTGTRKLFADADAGDWSNLHLRRHWQTQLIAGRGDEVLLTYPDGAAALSMTASPKSGGTVFVNMPLTPDGGDVIGSPMFPSMLQECLRTLRRGSERAVAPGGSWTLDVSTPGEGTVTEVDPEGHPVEAQILSSGRTTRLAMPAARLPGIYKVSQAGAFVGAGVVNIDPCESDTRSIALEQLKAGEGSAISVVRDEDELLLSGKTRPLWPQLAGAAVALIALEMLLLSLWRRPVAQKDGTPAKSSAKEAQP